MTNISIIQSNVLVKYRIFTEFLKEHYLEVYVELCQNYQDVMSKIYLNKFKGYIRDVEKLLVELYDKKDSVFSENISWIRNSLNLKGVALIDWDGNKSIF
jgi:vacuolar protein sorting-associated protein 52